MTRYKVWRSDLLDLEADERINEGEDCVYMLEEAPALARIRELESDIEECQTYRCQQKDINNAQVIRITELEAALDDRRSPKATEWKYLDDGVTLMRAALDAIPERYRDGEPNQLHDAIKEWLARPERAALAPKELT